jgi:hypothetical protein
MNPDQFAKIIPKYGDLDMSSGISQIPKSRNPARSPKFKAREFHTSSTPAIAVLFGDFKPPDLQLFSVRFGEFTLPRTLQFNKRLVPKLDAQVFIGFIYDQLSGYKRPERTIYSGNVPGVSWIWGTVIIFEKSYSKHPQISALAYKLFNI